jgi:hypothetical protein
MENPYASPAEENREDHPSGWIKHLRIVAILLIVQGNFEFFCGWLLFYQWKRSLLWITVVLLLALCKVIAGICNIQWRNRTLGIIALTTAPVSLLTVLCFPSAMVVMIYGLVVYNQAAIKKGFAAKSPDVVQR